MCTIFGTISLFPNLTPKKEKQPLISITRYNFTRRPPEIESKQVIPYRLVR